MNAHRILKRPLVLTEKGNAMREQHNKFMFEVALEASKHQIRDAVESQFPNVHVVSIRTLIVRGLERRIGRSFVKSPNWKKAIVELRKDEKIEFFEAF